MSNYSKFQYLINIFFRPWMKKDILLLCMIIMLSLIGSDLSAQYTILYNDAATDPLPTEDINTCQDLVGGFENTARIVILDNDADQSSVTITLPPGIEYTAGSINTISTVGGLTITESNITDLSNPVFTVNPTNVSAGNEITFSWGRAANCDAVDYQMAEGIFKDIITVDGAVGSVVDNTMNLNSYDLLVTALSIISHAPVSTNVGTTEMVDLVITNGGQGCTENFNFYIINEDGICTTDLTGTISSTPVSVLSVSGDTTFYAISQSLLQAEGLGDCLDNGEQLFLDRVVEIKNCNIQSNYGVNWGCNGQDDCQDTFEVPGDFSIVIGVPNITATENIPNLDLWCLDGEDFAWTFTNVGTEPSLGTGGAYNIEVSVGWDWNAPWNPAVRTKLPWSNFNIGGVALTASLPGYTIDLSTLLPVGVDPDGPGGLEDLDGDGVFDDLPVGASFDLDFYMDYLLACQAESECAPTRRLNYLRPAWRVNFDDQCSSKEPTSDDTSPSIYWLERFSPLSTGPTDMNDCEIIPFNFYVGWISSGIVHHPDDRTELRLILPPGLNLAPIPNATLSDVTSPIISATQTGNIATIVSEDYFLGNFSVDLKLDCAAVVSSSMTVDWEFWHLPNNGVESCCEEKLVCESISLVPHCPLNCPGIATTAFDSDRNTFGWTDHTMTTMVTAATASEFDIIYKGDNLLVNSPGVVSTDLDQVWIDIEYTNIGACNPFDFNNGTWEIYDADLATTTVYPITAPVTIFDLGANRYRQRIDATNLIGTSLPAGFVFATGDSLNLSAELNFNGCGHGGSYYEFESFRATHKGVAPGGVDTLSCDSYGTRIEGHFPPSAYGRSFTYEVSGCETIKIDMAYSSISSSRTEDFPGEYRPIHRFDTSYADVPDYLEYIPNSGEYSYRIEGGNPTIFDFPDGLINITSNGDGTSRYEIINNGEFIASDKNNNGACCVNENLYLRFRPTCQMPLGSTTIRSLTDYTTHLYADPSCHAAALDQSIPITISYTPPILAISAITQNIQATKPEVEWEVEICNQTVTDMVDFNWLLLENLSSDIVVNSAVCQLMDSAGDPVGGTTTPVVNSATCGGSDAWLELGALNPGECKNIKVTGTFFGCDMDSLNVSHGWDCISYPVDPCAIDCQIEEMLYVESLQSEVQLVIDTEPIVPMELCATQSFMLKISSAQAAFLNDPFLNMLLPSGLMLSNVTVEFPAGSGNIELANSTMVGNLLSIDLEAHPQMTADGIPGTLDALTPLEREVYIRFDIDTDCDFISGNGIVFQAFGKNACGNSAINNGVRARSSDLFVDGASPPYFAGVNIDLEGDEELIGCAPSLVTVNMELLANSANITNVKDSVLVTLEAGVEFVPSSFICCSADASHCFTFVYESTDINGFTTVAFAYPSVPINITNPVSLCFTFEVTNAASMACDTPSALTVESRASAGEVPCATVASGVCPDIQVLTGQAFHEFTSEKIELTYLDDGTFTCDISTGALSYNIPITIDSMDIAAGEFLAVDVYCATAAGVAGTLVSTEMITGPAAMGSIVNLTGSVPNGVCDLSNGLIFQVNNPNTAGINQCICEDLEIKSESLECILCIVDAMVTGVVGTCLGGAANNDASIDISAVTDGDEANYSLGASYIGPDYGDVSGLDVSGGSSSIVDLMHNTEYTVRVFNGSNACFADYTITTVDLSCFVCPTITNPTADLEICDGQAIPQLRVEIDALGADEIEFVYFTIPQSGEAMYTGGTSLGIDTPTVGEASIINVLFPSIGTYYVYAILSPTPSVVTCRPFEEIIVTVSELPNITLAVSDPEICEEAEIEIEVMNTEIGVQYKLQNASDNSDVGSSVVGNGSTIVLGVPMVMVAGSYTYNVVATNSTTNCMATLTDEAMVTINECDYPILPPTNCPNFNPCHIISTDLYLGTQSTADQGNTGTADDNDGVIFPNDIRPSGSIRLPVTIFNNTTNDAYLTAWIDWNGDGDFDDASEQIASKTYVYASNNGSFVDYIEVMIPSDAIQDVLRYAIFRLSTDDVTIMSTCSSTGACAIDGEVEVYSFTTSCKAPICVPPTIRINE